MKLTKELFKKTIVIIKNPNLNEPSYISFMDGSGNLSNGCHITDYSEQCPVCKGNGRKRKSVCPKCHGRGYTYDNLSKV